MLVSIVIPIYNVEPYIKACLDSVVAQTVTDDIECILVDDRGTDHSMQIAEEYVSNYKGNILFHIIHHEENRGLSAARNTGISVARGKYIYFMDSDDELLPNCLKMMCDRLQQYGEVDLVQGFIFEDKCHTSNVCPYDIPDYTADRRTIKSFLLKYEGDIIPAQNRLVKTSLIRDNNLYFKEGIIHEDNYWAFFLAKYVRKMCACKKRAYHHRYNPTSITGNVNKSKERIAYISIITELTDNIDPFLAGKQKEYILCNLITAMNGGYFTSQQEEHEMINRLLAVLGPIEGLLIKLYFKARNQYVKTKLFRLLSWLFKV